MEGRLISDTKASKLDNLIGDTGNGFQGVATGSTHRLLAFVRVITWNNTTKLGTCVVTEFDSAALTWQDYGTASDTILLSANDDTLTVGKRYLSKQYGQASGNKTVFIATAFTLDVSSSSLTSGGGNSVCVLTDVWCQGGGVYGDETKITAYVKIGGTNFPVTFQTSACSGGSTSGGGSTSPPPPPPLPPPP